MAATTSWLSLTDLGRIYGISAVHCGKTIENQGWRDRRGRPTQSALDANAAMQTGPHGQGRTVLWNRNVCSQLLEQKGYCLLYTSPSPRDQRGSRMPSSA